MEIKLLYSLVISYGLIFLSILVHELGHLIMGLLTGYKFFSIRFFSFFIVKSSTGKISLKREKMQGVMGQCLMGPPEKKPMPFFLYIYGGVLFQFILNSFYIILLLTSKNKSFKIALLAAIVINFIIIFFNLIPIKWLGNDGSTYNQVRKNDKSREAMYHFLKNNYLTHQGVRLTSIDMEETKIITQKLDDRVQMLAARNIYLQQMLKLELIEALSYLEDFEMRVKKYVGLDINIDATYKYLIEILIDKQNIQPIKSERLKHKLKNPYDLNTASIKLVEKLYTGDIESFNNEYSNFIKICTNHPNVGLSDDYYSMIKTFIKHTK